MFPAHRTAPLQHPHTCCTPVGALLAHDEDTSCADDCCTSLDRPHATLSIVASASAPTACTLVGTDHDERVSDWHHLLAGVAQTKVPGGVNITLPMTALEQTATLATAEQACCGFYTFHLDLHGTTFTLTIIAPPQAHPMLEDLLPTQQTAPS